jgi:hypothetical protein
VLSGGLLHVPLQSFARCVRMWALPVHLPVTG